MAYAETLPAQTRPHTANKINPIQWLLRLEAAYREHCKPKDTEDRLLEDMGITRRQANTAFYRQFGQYRYYSR